MASDAAAGLVPPRSHDDNSLEAHNDLLEWVAGYGGNLHESVQISKDESRGVHIQVRRDWNGNVPKETRVIKTPLPLTMSYFNAIDYRLPTDAGAESPTFSSHGVVFPRAFIDAVGPEETSAFFLMGQYLRGSEGFWYPYLRTLPAPGSLTTPLYYERGDAEWLQGTSLFPAREQRVNVWEEKYKSASDKLMELGFQDAERYTWDLYQWASTIITSRAFSSKVLSGVIPDTDLPEDRVSVLLPLIDLPNHRPLAKVEWRAGEEDVALLVLEDIAPGQEISNNYGPRNNEQLMMNYGFCLPDNPTDYRIVSLRAPPGSPLDQVKRQQLQAFPDLAKDRDDHYYVFNIFYPLLAPESPMEHTIFSPALFNAVSILAANDRELESIEITESGVRIVPAYGNSRNILAALCQIIIELITHIVKLRSTGQAYQRPETLKQTYAKIYRDSQITLSETALIIAAWTLRRAQKHGMKDTWEATKELLNSHMSQVPANKFPDSIMSRIRVRILERQSLLKNSGELFLTRDLFGILPAKMQESCRTFFRNILAHSEVVLPMLRGTGEASPFAFPMFVCFVTAAYREKFELPWRLMKWTGFLLEKYPPPPDDVAWMLEEEDDERLVSAFDDCLEGMKKHHPSLFSAIAEFTGDNQKDDWWLSPNWVRWAWMIMEQESIQAPADPLRLLAEGGIGQNVMLSTVSYLYIPQDSGNDEMDTLER